MKKEHLTVIKDAIKTLGAANDKFDSVVSDAVTDIDQEVENLGKLADALQEQYDDMTEKTREGDKGTELQELIDAVGEVKSDLEDLKDDFNDAPLDDIITKLDELATK